MPEVIALEYGDPLFRMVAGMCLYARDIEQGALPGPYNQSDAELYARTIFMPVDEFEPLVGLVDDDLAMLFGMPVGEVAQRRRDLRDGDAADESK